MKPTGLIALVALLAAPLAAQEPSHPQHPTAPPGRTMDRMPMMHGMDDMMGPMMRVMAFTPEHLLARKDALGLTAQQVTRLTALRDAAKTAHEAAAADAKAHHTALAQAMASATPDTASLRQHFQAAHAAMGTAHWTMLRAGAQAKAVLTEGQRGRVDGWVDAMEMHRKQMQDGHEGMERRERPKQP